MEDSVIVFSVLNIKREWADKLPIGFGGWTTWEECNIFAECVEKIIGRNSGFSPYLLDLDDFQYTNGKITCVRPFEQINQLYVTFFSVDLLQKIFYDEEFTTDFLRRILPMFIEEQHIQMEELQKHIAQSQECLDNLNNSVARLRTQNSGKKS